jgi:hypothetical protein
VESIDNFFAFFFFDFSDDVDERNKGRYFDNISGLKLNKLEQFL